MEDIKKEKTFMNAVDRINRYLIMMGIFFLVYFLIITKVDKFLFLLSISNISFVLVSHRLLTIARELDGELQQARALLKEYAVKVAKMGE